MFDDLNLRFAKLQFGPKVRNKLYRRIGKYLRNGVTIYDALSEMAEEMLTRNRNHPVGLIVRQWVLAMRHQGRFSEVVKGWVPSNEQVIIAAGETAGDLPNALDQVCFLVESKRKMISSILGGMLYNTVLITMLFGMMYLFASKVVPQIEEVLPANRWPDTSQILYHISRFIHDYALLLLLGLSAMVALAGWSVPRVSNEFRHRILDRLPPWSIYKIMQSAAFLVALSAMMKSGKPFYDSLITIARSSSAYVRTFIEKMVRRLAEGQQQGLGSCFQVGLLSVDDEIDLKLMSKFGEFEETIHVMGVDIIDSGVQAIQARMALVGAVILFLIAAYVGFSYYCIYLVIDTIGGQAGAGV